MHDGIPGHTDVIVYHHPQDGKSIPVLVIDFKYSAWTGEHSGPKDYQVIQTAKYALAADCDRFQVVTYYPSTQARYDKALGTKVSQPHLEPSQVYATAEYADAVAKEYARLSGALAEEMPITDPAETWRCSSCRYGACERNTNSKNTNPKPKLHALTS